MARRSKKKEVSVETEEKVEIKRRPKYRAKKTEVTLEDGTTMLLDSKKEARRYEELITMKQSGEISNLRLQVPYELVPKQKRSDGKTERSVKYIADFVYEKDGETIVEDVKGMRTDVYRLKRKLMLWVFGIEVYEV